MRYGPPEIRFWQWVEKTTGCWNWTGLPNTTGYGTFFDGRKPKKAHRFAYEMLVGPIPLGLTIDHLCRNRLCVNPAHLEAVTNRENVLRGTAPAARQARQTHCKRGHALSGANLRKTPAGRRICRTCRRDWGRAYWHTTVRPSKSA